MGAISCQDSMKVAGDTGAQTEDVYLAMAAPGSSLMLTQFFQQHNPRGDHDWQIRQHMGCVCACTRA